MRKPAENHEPAEWLAERLLERPDPSGGVRVGAIVPTGFEAYARVFPRLYVPEKKRLSWAELAAINGRLAHPLMEFHLIASPVQGYGPSPLDPEQGPEGPMHGAEIRELAEVLRGFYSDSRAVLVLRLDRIRHR